MSCESFFFRCSVCFFFSEGMGEGFGVWWLWSSLSCGFLRFENGGADASPNVRRYALAADIQTIPGFADFAGVSECGCGSGDGGDCWLVLMKGWLRCRASCSMISLGIFWGFEESVSIHEL